MVELLEVELLEVELLVEVDEFVGPLVELLVAELFEVELFVVLVVLPLVGADGTTRSK